MIFASITDKGLGFCYELINLFIQQANLRAHMSFLTWVTAEGLLRQSLVFFMVTFLSIRNIVWLQRAPTMLHGRLDHYGTIQVSVLGFVDLPSSLPSSSISIKVSLGKREYQTLEKGDFSFPLASLREKLIITLYDAEENKISDTGVEAISVVEKGIWDDYFPLEGGGHVHMKLQFTLSEEERNRIRMMRETASKKKHSELLNSSPQRTDTASILSNTVSSSLSHIREVSAGSTGEVATQAIIVSNPVNFHTDPQSGSGIKEGTRVGQEQTNANDTDTSEVTSFTAPVPQGIEVHRTEAYSQGSVKATKIQPPPDDGSMHPKEVSSLVGSPDTSEVTLSTAPVPQGIEVHTTEAYSRGPVQVIETQSPSVDRSMYPKEVLTLVGSSDTSGVILSTTPVPQGIEVHSIEVYSPGPVQVIETRSPSVDGSMHPKEVSTLVGSSDTSEVASSTAPVAQGIEVQSTEVYSPGSLKATKIQPPSIDGSMYPKEVSSLVGRSDTSEMPLSTAHMPQGIEVHSTEVYSRGPVEVIKSQSPSVDGSMHQKEVSTLIGSSETREVTSSTAPVPQGIEVRSTELYSRGPVQVIKTQSPVDRSMYPKEVSTLIGSSETNEVTLSTAPVAQGIEVHSTEQYSPRSVKMIKTQSHSVDGPVHPKEVSTLVGSSELVVSAKNKTIPPKQEKDQTQNPEKQGPLEKTPSNVRKMISAFESSRAQDTRPDYKPTTIKTPSSKVGMGARSKESHTRNVRTEITRPTKESSVRVTNLFLKDESLQTMPYFKRRGQQLNSKEAIDGSKSSQHIGQLKESSTEKVHSKGMNSSLKDEVISQIKVPKKEENESLDLMRVSTVEEATVSGQMLDEHLVRQQPTNSLTDSKDSAGTSAMMESAREIHSKDSRITNLQSDSNDTLKSLWYHEDKQNSRKSSGTWIFPEEAIEICVTTGCSAEASTRRGRMSFSAPQHVQERSLHVEDTFCTPRESELDNSAEVEKHRGPVGQGIKVAIMVGFGTLVLLTRQSKSKNR